MEQLKHKNDIEIKLLANRRFIYSNRRSSIVITAEHNATDIIVLYPEEFADYSKRVDFINSQGKEWTEGLYVPEFKHYPPGLNKCRFHFTLPTEVTTEGELKMQFLAYLPDESMTTVPFEIIPIDVLNGVLAFKRSSKSNPDLLILSANYSTQALFNSQKAVAKSENAERISENAERISQKADEQSQAAVETSNKAMEAVIQTAEDLAAETLARTAADNDLQASIDAEIARATQAESDIAASLEAEIQRAQSTESTLAAAVADEEQARLAGDEANAQAIAAETERAQNAEAVLTADLAAEAERAARAESDITAALDNETSERKSADDAETEARIAGDAANADAIFAETQRAQNAENNLEAALISETERAKQAEETNASVITAETERATIAENDLAAGLAAEMARSQTTDDQHAAAIEAEFIRAQGAENDLQTALAVERTRATNAENDLQAAIMAEEARAISVEADISSALNTEIAHAKTQEQINADATAAEVLRAKGAEAALGLRIDTEVPAALSAAKAYAEQITEQVRIDGTIYKGICAESELPLTGNENGDLYWISEFNITEPEHSGTAIFNGKTNVWDFNIDRYKHEDNDTIVSRASDGALKVADTNEINLVADTTDFGASVSFGFKALVRAIIRKIRGLFQKSSENAAAITTETERAQIAESGLSSSISAEVARAKTAEQLNANAIQAEVGRAQTAENELSANLTAETSRAQTAEQTNTNAIAAETSRAQSAESGLSVRINAEETRAKTAEQTNVNAITAETTRAKNAEDGLSAALSIEAASRQSGDTANAQALAAEVTRAQAVEASKVDKIAGKGLSTEDYTTAEKSKLLGIEDGANKYIHPTTHPPAIIAQDASNRFVTDIEKGTWNGKAEKSPATQSLAGLMSAADKTKLDGITPGDGGIPVFITGGVGTAYTVTAPEFGTVFSSGLSFIIVPHINSAAGTVTLSINGTIAKPLVRFSTSDGLFANVGAYTQGLTKDRPAFIFYDNTNDNYVIVNRPLISWSDLLNAPTIVQAGGSSTLNIMSQKAVTDSLGLKVDKVTGKGLSTEDYTSAEKTKLAGIENNANNYAHPANHPPSIITQDASNRFVTDIEKAAWNAKAEKTTATQSANGLMSAADKTKLDGVENNANNYAHPSSHPPSIITQDASNRFVTDTEKATWNAKAEKTTATQSANGLMSAADKTKLDGVENNANKYIHPTTHPPAIIAQDASNRFVTDTEKATWNAKAEKTTATQSANGLMSAADKTKLDTLPTVDDKSTQLVSNQYEVKGFNAAAASTIPMKNTSSNGFDWLRTNTANGIPILNASGYLTQLALNARADESGNTITSFYLPKNNGTVTGYLAFTDTNSKLSRGTTSPAGNNIGVTGVMLTHYSSDEGGIMINEDGAYLWNSTDSGSLFRGLDEDVWTSATTKYNATFTTGLMFDFDSTGNLKLKGNIFVNNGATQLYNVTSLPASSITVTANSNLGNYTNLQDVLNYIANVFAGTQKVTKIRAGTLDVDA